MNDLIGAAWFLSSALGFVSLTVTLLGVAVAGYGIVRYLSLHKNPMGSAAPMLRDRIVRFGMAGFFTGAGLQVLLFVLRLTLPGHS
jgi:hypothetical protein